LIVDCGPAHRKRKAGAFAQTLGRKLRWFFLPPHAPERNPGGLARQHRKAAGRTAITGKDNFNREVRSSMRQPQNNPKKSAPSIGTPLSNTLHEREATYA
jgi:hypothetical protein